MKEIIEECLNQAFEEFGIDAKGKVTNMPEPLDPSDFFRKDED